MVLSSFDSTFKKQLRHADTLYFVCKKMSRDYTCRIKMIKLKLEELSIVLKRNHRGSSVIYRAGEKWSINAGFS